MNVNERVKIDCKIRRIDPEGHHYGFYQVSFDVKCDGDKVPIDPIKERDLDTLLSQMAEKIRSCFEDV